MYNITSTTSASLIAQTNIESAEDIIDYMRQYDKCKWWEIGKKSMYRDLAKGRAHLLNYRNVRYIRIKKMIQ